MILALIAFNIVILAAIVFVKLHNRAVELAKQRQIGKGHIASVPSGPRYVVAKGVAKPAPPQPTLARQVKIGDYDVITDRKVVGFDAAGQPIMKSCVEIAAVGRAPGTMPEDESFAEYRRRKDREKTQKIDVVYGTQTPRPSFDYRTGQTLGQMNRPSLHDLGQALYGTRFWIELLSAGEWHGVESFDTQPQAEAYAADMRRRQNVTLRVCAR